MLAPATGLKPQRPGLCSEEGGRSPENLREGDPKTPHGTGRDPCDRGVPPGTPVPAVVTIRRGGITSIKNQRIRSASLKNPNRSAACINNELLAYQPGYKSAKTLAGAGRRSLGAFLPTRCRREHRGLVERKAPRAAAGFHPRPSALFPSFIPVLRDPFLSSCLRAWLPVRGWSLW